MSGKNPQQPGKLDPKLVAVFGLSSAFKLPQPTVHVAQPKPQVPKPSAVVDSAPKVAQPIKALDGEKEKEKDKGGSKAEIEEDGHLSEPEDDEEDLKPCFVCLTVMWDEKPKKVGQMYRESGEAVDVCAACVAGAIKDFKFTVDPPKKKSKLFDAAPQVPLSQGLAQMFTCYKCGGMADAADDCDWVKHDEDQGGCGGQNIIANGHSHSRLNEAFRSSTRGLKKKDGWPKVEHLLKAHQKAESFWGFEELFSIVEKRDAAAWKRVKDNAIYIHRDMEALVHIIDALMTDSNS